jgi:hypothetical protein
MPAQTLGGSSGRLAECLLIVRGVMNAIPYGQWPHGAQIWCDWRRGTVGLALLRWVGMEYDLPIVWGLVRRCAWGWIASGSDT